MLKPTPSSDTLRQPLLRTRPTRKIERKIESDVITLLTELSSRQSGSAAHPYHHRPGYQFKASRWPSWICSEDIFEATALRSLK